MAANKDPRETPLPRDVSAIIDIRPDDGIAYVPPLSDYKNPSSNWTEVEYRFFESRSDHVTVGYWTGEPGSISYDAWPYMEVCSILSGRVAVKDPFGAQRQFGPGSVFIVPKGWAGEWITLESATKIFIAID
jgi:uncharacterized cupin superfamily protein